MRAFADSWMKLLGVYKSAVVWGGPSFLVYVSTDILLLVTIALHRAVLVLRGEAAADPSPYVPYYRVVRDGATTAVTSNSAPPPQSCSQGGCCGGSARGGDALPHLGFAGWATRLFAVGSRPFEYTLAPPRSPDAGGARGGALSGVRGHLASSASAARALAPLKSGRDYFVASFLVQVS